MWRISLLALLLPSAASAVDMTVQMRVVDSSGEALQGAHSVTVRILDDASAEPPSATVLHTQSFTGITIENGYFLATLTDVPDTVQLGAGATFLEYTVDSTVLLPRTPITGVPLAAVAHRLVPSTSAFQPHEGALRLPDNTAAASCAAYLAHGAYGGEHWERFWVDPDGAATGEEPFQVRCDMTTDGGGWAIWEAPGGPWGWNRLGLVCYDTTLITEGQAWQMSLYTHSEAAVDTDVTFYFGEDDSVNPGNFHARLFANVDSEAAYDASFPLQFDYTTSSSNHVDVTFSPNGADRIRANCASASNGCNKRNIPANGADSAPLFLTAIHATPKCSGATAAGSVWSRNATQWQGSYYPGRTHEE